MEDGPAARLGLILWLQLGAADFPDWFRAQTAGTCTVMMSACKRWYEMEVLPSDIRSLWKTPPHLFSCVKLVPPVISSIGLNYFLFLFERRPRGALRLPVHIPPVIRLLSLRQRFLGEGRQLLVNMSESKKYVFESPQGRNLDWNCS